MEKRDLAILSLVALLGAVFLHDQSVRVGDYTLREELSFPEELETVPGDVQKQSEEIPENESITIKKSLNESDERFPESNETRVEELKVAQNKSGGLGKEVPATTDSKITYFFFHADYCSTCRTMLPFIAELEDEHPSLEVRLIDIHSGSSYIEEYAVAKTAVSVILREEGGQPVSGTKVGGFMDKDAIESFICTELEDEKCNNP